MPTKRRQNTPGPSRRPSRNSAAGKRSVYGAHAAHKQGGFSTSGPQTGYKPRHSAKGRPSVATTRLGGTRPSATNARFGGARTFTAANAQESSQEPKVLFTRRNVLIGAAAVGGVAALGGGISFAVNTLSSNDSAPDCLSVAEGDVHTHSDFTLIEDYSTCVRIAGRFELPYGTLVWADGDTLAACLVPGEEPSPLNTVSVLNLTTGNRTTIFKAAQDAEEGFEIFDVRCSEEGLVWVECNTYTNIWRIYTARLSSGEASIIQQVDEGDSNWLIPSLAAVGDKAFWQTSPKTDGEASDQPAVLRATSFGSEGYQEIYTSSRAFATRLSCATDGVVITPIAEGTTTYYQLVKVNASDYSVGDALTLPASMTPDIAGYGATGLAFGFTDIYSYGGGIANLGTYTPTSAPEAFSYNNVQWLRFGRTPITAPCWCGGWIIVKSTTALCGIDPASQTYFAIDTVSGSDDYGEHLVSSGSRDTFVGLSQITSDDDETDDYALVRVFKPLSNDED